MAVLAPRLALCAALLLAVGACADGTSPVTIASVKIMGAPTAPLTAGDSVTLTTSIQNSQGVPVTDAVVSWSSTVPGVAVVSGSGQLKALAPGTTQIIATVEGVSDTVTVTVLASANGCAGSGLSMAIGEVRRLDAAKDPAVCLAPGSGDYALVACYGQETGTSPGVLNLTVETTSAAPASAFGASLAPVRDPFLLAPAGPRQDWSYEVELRARQRKELARYLPALRATWGKTGTGPSFALAADVPTVGSTLNLNVGEGCETPVRRAARVAAVSDRAIIAVDPDNPSGSFTDAEYRDIAIAFDTLVYPIDTANFGEPTDLDNNGGRVIIFYTRAVNELTEKGSESFVGGFFNSRDLFPPTTTGNLSGCTGSNYGEMFYVLAADPTGAINGVPRSKDFIRGITLSTTAHEFKHLIGGSRRLYIVKTNDYFDEVWLEEGVAHMAQELVFYKASGLTPGQNISAATIRSARRVDAFNDHLGGNFGNLQSYLESPETSSPYAADDELATRGAAWNFLRYAVDRVGGDQTAIWRRLVNSSLIGFANLRAGLGTEPMPLFRDWSVSLYADDAASDLAEAYQQPTWNLRSIFPAITTAHNYPLRVRPLSSGSAPFTLTTGGSAYFTITPAASVRSNVRFRSAGLAPPSTLSLHVVRTR
jgi:hypothetical protein